MKLSNTILLSAACLVKAQDYRINDDDQHSDMLLIDLTGDGVKDLVAGGCHKVGDSNSDIAMYRGGAGGLPFGLAENVWKQGPISNGNGNGCADNRGSGRNALVSGDVNGNGLLDLVVASDILPQDGPTFFVLENFGDLNFTRTSVFLDDSNTVQGPTLSLNNRFHRAQGVKLVDLDGDGSLDIVATLFDLDNGMLAYYLNDGRGNFAEPVILNDGLLGRAFLDVGDMTGDGDVDIVVVSRQRRVLWLYENDLASSGEFTETVLNPSVGVSSESPSSSIVVGDLTGK